MQAQVTLHWTLNSSLGLQHACRFWKKTCNSAHSQAPWLERKQERLCVLQFLALSPRRKREVSRIEISIFRTVTSHFPATFQTLSWIIVQVSYNPNLDSSDFFLFFPVTKIKYQSTCYALIKEKFLILSRHTKAPAEITGGFNPHYSYKTHCCHWSLFLIAVILPKWLY